MVRVFVNYIYILVETLLEFCRCQYNEENRKSNGLIDKNI
jgi:hypothetical protein